MSTTNNSIRRSLTSGHGYLRRFAQASLSGIQVRKAVTDADFQVVANLRMQGFTRLLRSTKSDQDASQWLDSLDGSADVFSLIGYSKQGQPIGTMRVQDGRASPLELARFVPLETVVRPEYLPLAQFGRLSLLRSPQSTDVMIGMFKTAWKWAVRCRIASIIVASPPWARHIHQFLLFEDLGPQAHFVHQYAGGAPHITMRLPALKLEEFWRAREFPLCLEVFDTHHPALEPNFTYEEL